MARPPKNKIRVGPYLSVTRIERCVTLSEIHAPIRVSKGKYRVLFEEHSIQVDATEWRASTARGSIRGINLRASGEAAGQLLRIEAQSPKDAGVLEMETADGRAFEVKYKTLQGRLHLYGTTLQSHVPGSIACRVSFGDQTFEVLAYSDERSQDELVLMNLNVSSEEALIRALLADEPITVEQII